MKKFLLFVVAFLFVAANSYADYCAGTAPNSGGGNYYAINKIVAKVNGAEAFTWNSNGSNVQDASSTCSMEIKAGDELTFVMSSITSEGGKHSQWGQTILYFDWNQNQDWTDSGEKYVVYTNPGTPQVGIEYSVTVPSNFEWSATELKFRMNSGEAPQHNSYGEATPCQALSRGLMATFKATRPVAVTERTITFQVSPAGAGTLSNYQESSTVAISSVATANAGFEFVNWTLNGEVVSTITSVTDNTEGDKTYVANFQRDPKLDRSNWTITASSQEATGEGAGNGVASCIIDGNNSTFWHSQWNGSEPGYPHWFMIDMKEVKSFDEFEYVSRGNGTSDDGANNGNIVNYVLYVSDTEIDPNNLDAATKVTEGRFTYDGTSNSHKVAVTPAEGRYVMLYATGQSANGRVNASCTEFYLYSSSYTVSVSSSDATMGAAYIGTEGTTFVSCASDGTETVTLTAVPTTGYQFVNWTLDGVVVSTDAVYTTTAVTENRDYVANFEFKPVDPRTVKVASNDKTKGYAVFVSPMPEGTATDVTTGEIVTVRAITQTTNDVFVNWTINGEVVSTEETYSYAGAEAVTIQANFATLYPINIKQTSGGTISVKQGSTTLTNGDRVAAGSLITITVKGTGGQWAKALLINGENVLPSSQVQEYTTQVAVNGVTNITATFATPAMILTYEYTGGGYIEVWSSDSYNEGDEETFPAIPAGSQYAMWDEIEGESVCIFIYPQAGEELLSLTINGEGYDFATDLEEYGDIFYEPTEPLNIVAEFSGTWNSVESTEVAETTIYAVAEGVQVETAEATNVEVYSIAGTLVAEKVISGTSTIALAKGVYIVKAADKVTKVVVK
ncbi:MAG: discoidin domain-containing protein [Bacteroidaceae bacterium]|nr:discoidin domain-containing protein [Bacteroidaceae bacterium]